MKKTMWMLTAVLACLITSCRPQEEEKNEIVIDFDEVVLPDVGYRHQQAYVFTHETTSLQFGHTYTYYEEWGYDSWSGFIISNHVDTQSSGYTNQYSVMAGKAASGDNFALLFCDSNLPEGNQIVFADKQERRFKSISLCNATYPYLAMKNGDAFSKKFGQGDWFKLIIHAYDAQDIKTATKEIYLADFRQGKEDLLSEWKSFDLRELGEANKLVFEFSSSDVGMWGVNTPTYVCIDQLIYEE